MKPRGAVAIITGASSGIGAATARELARRGASVVLAARREAELLALVDEIERDGGRALAVPTDVSRREDIDRLAQAAIEQFGRIDVLVNNAGIGGGGALSQIDDSRIEHMLNVNLLAPARCIHAVLPHMRSQGGGVIVNLGSVAGELPASGLYSASKFGVRGLNDAMRLELKHDNIAVVLVEPGYIRTEMTADLRIPMPGPEAVARVIADAIERPRRKIIVPWFYWILLYLYKLFWWPSEAIIASKAYRRFYRGRKHTG